MSAKSRRNSPPRNAKRRRPAPIANNAARIDAALESLIDLATNEIKKEVESKPTPEQLQRQQELDDLAEESLLESMQMMRMAQQRIIKRMQEDPSYIPTSRELAISKEISKLALFQLRQREKRLARQERADREAAKILKQVEKETDQAIRDSERTACRGPGAALGGARTVCRVPALRQGSGTANDDGRAEGRGTRTKGKTRDLSGSRARGR